MTENELPDPAQEKNVDVQAPADSLTEAVQEKHEDPKPDVQVDVNVNQPAEDAAPVENVGGGQSE